jgi:hypothetical protein
MSDYELSENVTIQIYHTYEELMGYSEKLLELCYYNDGKWKQVESRYLDDVDNNSANDKYDGGMVSANVDKLGIYGLFINESLKAKGNFVKDNIRIYPNPYYKNKSKVDKVKIDGFGVIDNIKDVKIYNIAGELIATYKNAIKPVDDITNHSLTWNLKNDMNKEVASGLYIILIISKDNKSTFRKLAIIR